MPDHVVGNSSMSINDYLNLFPGYTRNHDRFMAFAEAVISQAVDLGNVVDSIQYAYSFEHAVGDQLDVLAASVGLRRLDIGDNVSDETFRQYLFSKFALWGWDGTNGDVKRVLDICLPESTQEDSMDGSVAVNPDPALLSAPASLFPYPAGIKMIDETEE